MKNTFSSIKKHLMRKYTLDDEIVGTQKSTNINVLLNRVRLDQKKESQKKILFSIATSVGVILFGVLIF